MNPFPRIGPMETADGNRCDYTIDLDPATRCKQTGVRHILWNDDQMSMACLQHFAKCQRFWTWKQDHAVGSDCNMPGSYWDKERNLCYVPGSNDLQVTLEAIVDGVQRALETVGA